MGQTLHIEQVSLFIGEGHLLSFCSGSGEVFEPIRERLRSSKGKLRHAGVDYLLYVLMDVVIDSAFPILEKWCDACVDYYLDYFYSVNLYCRGVWYELY